MNRITRLNAQTGKGKKGFCGKGRKTPRSLPQKAGKGQAAARNRGHLSSSMTARCGAFSCSHLRQPVRASAYG
ncbi:MULTISPECIES: hypothetical protein [Paraburkholderia]|uniref:hypothetical protein n=1 Tax=Paraburkholderia TaxID=1822464 RepID=UPI0013A69422|nr:MULTISPECIES: hypothetical protein [Paraburkholderia]MDH6152652.1 hypothetical protein [Paraburkholderia sp. WSM4179]